ncbi:hypothetical protein MVEG_02984 [Podila verticillata NRRL 6337]|nr:hypothetical protein MVEG_02984 [Podila verticillata NRRL 6337]
MMDDGPSCHSIEALGSPFVCVVEVEVVWLWWWCGWTYCSRSILPHRAIALVFPPIFTSFLPPWGNNHSSSYPTHVWCMYGVVCSLDDQLLLSPPLLQRQTVSSYHIPTTTTTSQQLVRDPRGNTPSKGKKKKKKKKQACQRRFGSNGMGHLQHTTDGHVFFSSFFVCMVGWDGWKGDTKVVWGIGSLTAQHPMHTNKKEEARREERGTTQPQACTRSEVAWTHRQQHSYSPHSYMHRGPMLTYAHLLFLPSLSL